MSMVQVRPRMSADAVASAERALATSWGNDVRLALVERIGEAGRRNLVLRCAVASAPPGSPATVIVKQAAMQDYDPERIGGAASGLLNDWCGAQFLTSLGCEPSIAPRCYAGSRTDGVVVLEDLGAARSLADVLLATERLPAEHASRSLATCLGRLHAATTGQAQAYRTQRAAMGPIGRAFTDEDGQSVRDGMPAIRTALDRLGIVPEPGFTEEAEAIARVMVDPGPFLAYTHGDPCPDNCLMVDGQTRLIDFEFGGFRHALIDGAFARMCFPVCWCVNRLPDDIITTMEQIYRSELAVGCPAARDDQLFSQALGDAGAMWALMTLSHILPRALDGVKCFGISTHRQRVPARLAAFIALEDERYPALRGTTLRVCSVLETRWSVEDHTLPVYPAFRATTRA